MSGLRGLLMLWLCCLGTAGWAAQDAYPFEDPRQQALFQELLRELRCPKCQNQDIADSHAELARDLRQKTYELVREGRDRQAVLAYMTARYGDFIHYSPPLQPSTLILWLGPLLFLLAGLVGLVWRTRRRPPPPVSLDESQRAELARLLKEQDDR